MTPQVEGLHGGVFTAKCLNDPHSCDRHAKEACGFVVLKRTSFNLGSESVHVAPSGSLAALGAVGAVKASILQLKRLVFESVFTIIPVFLALRSLMPILRVACWVWDLEHWVLKQFDSDTVLPGRMTLHTAFVDSTARPNASERQSIECRTSLFFPTSSPTPVQPCFPVQWQRASICLEVMQRLRLPCRKLLG